jgi:hypothetical protein
VKAELSTPVVKIIDSPAKDKKSAQKKTTISTFLKNKLKIFIELLYHGHGTES